MVKKYYKKVESVEMNALLGELDAIETCLDKVFAPGELKVYNNKVGDKYWYTQDDIDEFMVKHHRKAFA